MSTYRPTCVDSYNTLLILFQHRTHICVHLYIYVFMFSAVYMSSVVTYMFFWTVPLKATFYVGTLSRRRTHEISVFSVNRKQYWLTNV